MRRKVLKKLLVEAYRAGQESVSFMKLVHNGKAKVSHDNFCVAVPCKHKVEDETTTAEDEMVEKLLSKL